MANIWPENVRKLLSEYILEICQDTILEDLTCVLCMKLMNDAYQASCGCQYCRRCIMDFLGESQQYCRGGKDECTEEPLVLDGNVVRNTMLNRKILRTKVICPNQWCSHITEVSQMDKHLRVCITHSIECPYLSIGCDREIAVDEPIITHIHDNALSHTQLLIEWILNLKNEVDAVKLNSRLTDAKFQIQIDGQKNELEEQKREMEDQKRLTEDQRIKMEQQKREMNAQKMKIEDQNRLTEDQRIKMERQKREMNEQKMKIEDQKRLTEDQRIKMEQQNRELNEQKREIEDQRREINELKQGMKEQKNGIESSIEAFLYKKNRDIISCVTDTNAASVLQIKDIDITKNNIVDIDDLWKVISKEDDYTDCMTGFVAEKIENKKIECTSCHMFMCADCNREWKEQHENVTCGQYELWKLKNDSNLAKAINIECPKCGLLNALVPGRSLHTECRKCGCCFCAGCFTAFTRNCKLPGCTLGTNYHGHHPRNCLYYMRDYTLVELKTMLKNADYPKLKDKPEKTCQFIIFEERTLAKQPCGYDVIGTTGLCERHYKEYLVHFINRLKIDPASVANSNELNLMLFQALKKKLDKLKGENEDAFAVRLRNEVVKSCELYVPKGPDITSYHP